MDDYQEIIFKYVTLVMGVLIMICNLIKFYKIRNDHAGKSIIIIKSLTASDFLAGFFMVNLKVLHLIMADSLKDNPVAHEIHSFLRFCCLRFTLIASVISLVSITLIQVGAVLKPYVYRNITIRLIYFLCGITWTISIFSVLIFYLSMRIRYGLNRHFLIESDLIFPVFTYTATLIFFVSYTAIFMTLWKRRVVTANKASIVTIVGDVAEKREKYIESSTRRFELQFLKFATKTAVIFTMCWMPLSTCRLMKAVENSDCGGGNYQSSYFAVAFSSALINPFIYVRQTSQRKRKQATVDFDEVAIGKTINSHS